MATAIRTALIALLLLIPGLVVVRETQRAGVRGTAVQLSPHQYPELYRTAQDFAEQLGLRRRPDIFLANGNGSLNAFAAQATGHDYVVLSNELFVNLYQNNRDGLRIILGHEMGHIRLHHVALWYQIAVAYSERIPLLGPCAVAAARVLLRRVWRLPGPERVDRAGVARLGPVHRTRRRHRRDAAPGQGVARVLGGPRNAAEVAPLHGAQAGTAPQPRPVHP